MSGARRSRDWQKTDPHLRRHPMFARFKAALGVSTTEAHGVLSGIWAFAFDFAHDGDLSRFTPDDIALAIEWDGDADKLWSALSIGFISDGALHHWHEWGGALFFTRKTDAERKWDARNSDMQGKVSSDVQGSPGTKRDNAPEKRREEKRDQEPPLPPKPVDNSQDKSGDDSHESAEQTLEALRRTPTCEDRECAVRTLRCGVRGTIAQIVGPGEAGNLYNESTPLHKTLAGMAGYVCAAGWKASAAATMNERQPICRKAMVAYVDTVYDFHRKKPIRSLPAFLRTRYGNMTEAPVADELLAELRALEHEGDSGRKSEPVRLGKPKMPPPFAGLAPETQDNAAPAENELGREEAS